MSPGRPVNPGPRVADTPQMDDEALEAALRGQVEAWDPLQAAEPGLPEYGELVRPLRAALLQQLSRAELSELVWDHLEDHWGVQPWRCGVDQFVDRLITWRESWPVAASGGHARG
ncbi:MAG: hypothetical protein U0Q15_12160 [Kineosporiaceae bacterium]